MNLFYSAVTSEVSLGVINRLIDYYKPDNCYITYSKTNDYKKIVGCTVKEAYYHRAVKYTGNYEGYIYADSCPPLDENLLLSMSRHEPTILKMMERKYVRVEQHRPLPSYEERLQVYHRHLRYWNHLLDTSKIDVAVFVRTPHEVYDYVIYCLCKIKGIITATAREGPIRGFTYFFADIYQQYPHLRSKYTMLHNELSDTPIDDITLPSDMGKIYSYYCEETIDKSPFYVRHIKPTTPSTFKMVFEIIIKLLKGIKHKRFSRDLDESRKIMKEHPHRKRLYKAYDRLSVNPDFTKRYIYFPLQFQPELSTSPVGGVFVHQFLAIKMISYYLPPDVFIYVKEHPMQDSYCRKPLLYHDMTELPNVKLVRRGADTYELMKNSIAVASITGLAGFEGLFINKPFLMFGSTIVMYAPGVFVIRNNEDCQAALDFILKNGAKHTLKDVKIFMKVLGDYVRCCELNQHKNDFKRMGIRQYSTEENSERHFEGFRQVIDYYLSSTTVLSSTR